MRATLHDELMREAGFDSEYYAELARRRDGRRRKLVLDLLRATRGVAFVGSVVGVAAWIVDVTGRTDRLSPALIRGTFAAILIGGLADLALETIKRDEERRARGVLLRILARCLAIMGRLWERIH